MDTSKLFYQSVTAHYFYVSSVKDLRIVDIQIIRGIRVYYVEWLYDGSEHRTFEQRIFVSLDEMKLIVDAMENFYGSTSESCLAWNTLYLRCSHDCSKEL